MSQFLGFVTLEGTIVGDQITRNTSNGKPTDADALPTYRVYGSDDKPMTNGTGSLALKDSGTITAASNASPIVITSALHGLTTGCQVTISGIVGNLNANGTFIITVVDPNTFSLNGSTGSGSYVSGGSWHIAGLYAISFQAQAANGFISGQTYTILVQWQVSGLQQAETHTFTVV